MNRTLATGAALAALVLSGVASRAPAQQEGRRAIDLPSFDEWRSIGGETLSPDGNLLAYSLIPQDGDGEVVLRDLRSGAEHRHTRGYIGRPQTRPGSTQRQGPSFPSARFAHSAAYVVFTIEPARDEYLRAQRQRRRGPGQPRTALGIMRTSDGEVTVIPTVRSFQRSGGEGRWIAYLMDSDTGAVRLADTVVSGAPAAAAAAAPGGEARPVSDTTAVRRPRKEYGSTLVIRDLASGAETRVADVSAYTFDETGAWLGYTVQSRQEETDGAYVRALATGRVTPLLTGAGRYRALVFDRSGAQAAFASDREEFASGQPRFRVYHAALRAGRTRVLIGAAQLAGGQIIASTGRLTFTRSGSTLLFPVSPAPLDSVPSDSLAERAVFDLWHWRDARLQPQQRLEAARDRDRSFHAAYDLVRNRWRVLGNDSLPNVTVSADGRTALAISNVPYRVEAMWGEGGNDIAVVDVATGRRTVVAERVPFGASLSPDGRFVLWFDGEGRWRTHEVATGRKVDLTGGMTSVRFDQETWDTPSTPAPWGVAGWTLGDRSVLLYDRFDVWELDPLGRRAPRVVTDSVGTRGQIVFRVVQLDTAAVAFDPSAPLWLRARSDSTMASGYWRDRLDSNTPPVSVIMGDHQYGSLQKADAADAYLLTRQTVREFPDVWVMRAGRAPMRVTNANPQQTRFRWGTSELVRWRSADGVPLQGVLYKPESFDSTRQYPMVVYFYEQLSTRLHTYDMSYPRNTINPTFYTSHGYVVFMPDIAYQEGYPGPSALKSIVPGVQMLIDRGFVKPDGVGISGQSWGGYQVAYMITQTNLFRAAFAGAPVANMTSAYGGIRWESGLARPFQYERTQSRIGGSLWDYPLRYLENSPLFQADRVSTPLFIMHNDADGAVPWYQGIEMFVALRRLGREVYLINYNDDAHNPTKRANQGDMATRKMQFFDHHLRGAPAPRWMRDGIPFLERDREVLGEVATPVAEENR